MSTRARDQFARLRRCLAQGLRRPSPLSLALVAVVLLASAEAWARMGGGSSFSGGSSGGGGGGGGGDSDLVFFLIWLCIEHPVIGIPVAVIVGIVWIAKSVSENKKGDWETSGSPHAWTPPVPPALPNGRARLAELRALDPDFSVVVFEDFLYALYAKAHEARGQGRIATLSPYLSMAARARFYPNVEGLSEVKGVIIGGMRIVAVRGLSAEALATGVSVLFETNFTEVIAREGRQEEKTWYALERWDLSRRRGAKSRPPEKARKIGCPSCGAALTDVRGSVCSYCQKVVDSGEFDWKVDVIQVIKAEQRPPLFTSTVEEKGTHLPTVVALDVQQRLADLGAKDPEFDWASFRARAEMVFKELQAAWSEREWSRARPFVSDNLFQMQLYWIDTFKKQRIRNVIENPQVHDVHLASIVSDAHFDAVTVRVIASCLDYVVSEDGQHLSGSRSRTRRFTEYWTFIRGTLRKGRAGAEPKCPNCGAPLDINQAGTCSYCQAKVTTGDFDWVLSRIEQDESYGG